MAADPFNSKSGYTIGIPPRPFADNNGNIYTSYAELGNVSITGNTVSSGTISAELFLGTFQGNVEANIVVPGQNTWVLFNNNGLADASEKLKFDFNSGVLQVTDKVIANTYALGSGTSEFSSTNVIFATTASTASNQVLYATPIEGISSVDVTIIATDNTLNYRQISKLFAGILDNQVDYSEYGTIDVPNSSPGVADFTFSYNSGNLQLTVTPLTSNLTEYKMSITTYKE
jgi:hypothetical protein